MKRQPATVRAWASLLRTVAIVGVASTAWAWAWAWAPWSSVAVAASAPSAAAGAALEETPRALPTEDAIARTLANRRYRFCFDPKYPLLPDEERWCSTLPRSPDPRATRCPGLLDACRAGATANLMEKRKPIKFELPDFGGVGRAVLWTLVVAAIGGLIFFLVRHGLRTPALARARRESNDEPAQHAANDGGAAAEVVERDVQRLLARAQARAAAGDFAAAMIDLHAALFRRLEGDGHIRIHLSATNGDYVRELRGRAPGLAGPVGEVVRDVETAEFGRAVPDGGAYHTLLGRVTPLLSQSAGAAGASTGSALIGIVLLLASTLAACQQSMRPDWSASPSGTAAVAEFLTHAGITTRERIAPLRDLGKTKTDAKAKAKAKAKTQAKTQDGGEPNAKPGAASQIVLLPGAELGDAEWTALHAWLGDEDHTLIVATGPRAFPSWLADIEVVPTGASGPLRPGVALVESGLAPRTTGRVPGGAWVRSGIAQTEALIVRDERPYAAWVRTDAGRVIVLGDDRLLVNAALIVEENAALLEALLRERLGPIEFVGEDTGVVAPNPVASVTRGRLAPFLAQLGICLLLFLVMQGRAFGRLVDPAFTHRRVFSEHVRALGTQYARARAASYALGTYATWALDRLRERIHVSGGRGIGDLAAAVAARTDRPLGDVARALYAARREGDARAGGTGSTGSDTATAAAADDDRSRSAVEQNLAMMRELALILAETSASAPGRATLAARRRRGRPGGDDTGHMTNTKQRGRRQS